MNAITPFSGAQGLVVYDQAPPSCILVPVEGMDCYPHIKPGETAVVDTTDRDLVHGELYLVAWMGRPGPDGREARAIAQALLRKHNVPGEGEVFLWSVASLNRKPQAEVLRAIEAGRLEGLGWVNGPYCEGALEEQVRGRVIGLAAQPGASPPPRSARQSAPARFSPIPSLASEDCRHAAR